MLEPASFWRENRIADVILLRVLAKNVVVAEKSYQMLLSLCDPERAKAPSLKITVLTFLVKKCTMKLSGVFNVLRIREKNSVTSQPRSRVRPRMLKSLLLSQLLP